LLKRIAAQELDDLWNLSQRRLDPVLFPEVNRGVVNMKLEGKLALGELQVKPPDLDPAGHVRQKSGYFSLETGFLALKVKWQKGNTRVRR
jgi:hypothetical protein